MVQFLKDFGLPLGMLLVAIVVLWRDSLRLRRRNEELHERLFRLAGGGASQEQVDAVVAATQRLRQQVEKIVSRCRSCQESEEAEEEEK